MTSPVTPVSITAPPEQTCGSGLLLDGCEYGFPAGPRLLDQERLTIAEQD